MDDRTMILVRLVMAAVGIVLIVVGMFRTTDPEPPVDIVASVTWVPFVTGVSRSANTNTTIAAPATTTQPVATSTSRVLTTTSPPTTSVAPTTTVVPTTTSTTTVPN